MEPHLIICCPQSGDDDDDDVTKNRRPWFLKIRYRTGYRLTAGGHFIQ